jgi:tellurium resistance protein TerD
MSADTATFDTGPDALRTLAKDEVVSLYQLDPGLKKLMVGAGWDVVGFETDAIDIDLCAFLLKPDGMTRMDEDFVFYNNEKSEDGTVEHRGDNRTGAGDGDDENILIDLANIPFEISTIILALSVYDGDMRAQYFRNVRNLFVRLENAERGVELVRCGCDELSEESGDATYAVVFALERDITGWSVKAVCDFQKGGLHRLASLYGIEPI